MYGMVFEEIFKSTVREYGGDTVYVFIAMIVLSDQHGYIRETPASLARLVGKDIEAVKSAVANLCEPDPDSNSKEFDGRRIVSLTELTDGEENRGWLVVNKQKYAKLGSRHKRAALTTERSRKFRNKINDETLRNATQRSATRICHTDTDTDTKPSCASVDARFDAFWKAYPKRKSKGKALKAWKKLKPNDSLLADILQAIAKAVKSKDWQKDAGQFIPHPATWLNGRGWEDEYESTKNADIYSKAN